MLQRLFGTSNNSGESRVMYSDAKISSMDSKPVVPRGRSLEDLCEGDPAAEHIEFTHDVSLDIDALSDTTDSPLTIAKPMPLYHAHVLWSLIPSIVRASIKVGSFELSLISAGPHIDVQAFGPAANPILGPNEPKAQGMPEFIAGSVTFLSKCGKEMKSFEFEMLNHVGKLLCVKRFTRAELDTFADGTVINLRLCVIVARSYFDLSKQLIKPTTVPESKRDMVKQILRGEKPPLADWSITLVPGASGDSELPTEYFVHARELTAVGGGFQESYATAQRVGATDGFFMPCFEADDMPVVISIIYGLDAPLPTNIERVGMLGRALNNVLSMPVLLKVFAQWERAICEKALALDKHDAQASCRVLNELLTIVWCCPLGSVPSAKRAAVATLADMIWLHAPPGVDVRELYAVADVFHDMLGESHVDLDHIGIILNSVHKHISRVTTVRKVGLPSSNKGEEPKPPLITDEAKQEDSLPSAHSLVDPIDESSSIARDSPTVVAIENDEEEGNEQEEEEEPERATWQCAIS